MAFLWCTLHVSNLEKSVDFYEKYTGLKVSRRFKSGMGMEIAFLGNGETSLELVAAGEDKVYPTSDQISIGFSTDSVDKALKRFEDDGIEIYRQPVQPNPHLRFFFVQDPDGVNVQFVEHL